MASETEAILQQQTFRWCVVFFTWSLYDSETPQAEQRRIFGKMRFSKESMHCHWVGRELASHDEVSIPTTVQRCPQSIHWIIPSVKDVLIVNSWIAALKKSSISEKHFRSVSFRDQFPRISTVFSDGVLKTYLTIPVSPREYEFPHWNPPFRSEFGMTIEETHHHKSQGSTLI